MPDREERASEALEAAAREIAELFGHSPRYILAIMRRHGLRGPEVIIDDAPGYEWVPDRQWRVGGDGRTCRQLRCPNAAVAAILRRDRRTPSGVWWHYCGEHLCGRLIVDGVVCYRRVHTHTPAQEP